MYECMNACMYVCVYVWVCVCMCVYVCMCVCYVLFRSVLSWFLILWHVMQCRAMTRSPMLRYVLTCPVMLC